MSAQITRILLEASLAQTPVRRPLMQPTLQSRLRAAVRAIDEAEATVPSDEREFDNAAAGRRMAAAARED